MFNVYNTNNLVNENESIKCHHLIIRWKPMIRFFAVKRLPKQSADPINLYERLYG